ncbi:MAG: tagaturonate epimerase family protein [Thermoguttaceae bacterium]|jgi:hypothetical protein
MSEPTSPVKTCIARGDPPHLPKYSLGVGDRFGHQGPAQLDALILAREQGVQVTPVWNKSHREHTIVGSAPGAVRAEADAAVRARGWHAPYFVDADHVGLQTVDGFLEACDFFTLDVADEIGADPPPGAVARFLERHRQLIGRLTIPGLARPLEISEPLLAGTAGKFLAAVAQAGRICRRIQAAKGPGDCPNFRPTKMGLSPSADVVIEVSMDETDQPQSPAELLVILAALADEGVPAQTIAPRFSGRFNKGVDYVGDPLQFRAEFQADLAVVAFATAEFGLPAGLKLSVHSGSDKFSLYPLMRELLARFDAGLHLKTAGTTWLEELIGLAAAGGDGLAIAKEIYAAAVGRMDELCRPYAAVIDIDVGALPPPDVVQTWDGPTFAAALHHDPACRSYNPSLRQLLHVGYRIAAELAGRFTAALEEHAAVIATGVTENLWQRHIRPLFPGL